MAILPMLAACPITGEPQPARRGAQIFPFPLRSTSATRSLSSACGWTLSAAPALISLMLAGARDVLYFSMISFFNAGCSFSSSWSSSLLVRNPGFIVVEDMIEGQGSVFQGKYSDRHVRRRCKCWTSLTLLGKLPGRGNAAGILHVGAASHSASSNQRLSGALQDTIPSSCCSGHTSNY